MSTKKIIAGLAIAAGLVLPATGAFATGQSTRMTDAAVTAKVDHAVDSALARAAAKAATHEDDAVRAAVARTQQSDAYSGADVLKDARRAAYKRGVKAGKEAAYATAPAVDSGVDQTAESSDGPTSTECHTFNSLGMCTETPEYDELCSDLYDQWEAARDPITGNSNDETRRIMGRYSKLGCDQR